MLCVGMQMCADEFERRKGVSRGRRLQWYSRKETSRGQKLSTQKPERETQKMCILPDTTRNGAREARQNTYIKTCAGLSMNHPSKARSAPQIEFFKKLFLFRWKF